MLGESSSSSTQMNDLVQKIESFYRSGQIDKGRMVLNSIPDSIDLEQPQTREMLADAYVVVDDIEYYFEWYKDNLFSREANVGDQILVYALICHNRNGEALNVFDKIFPALSSIHNFTYALRHIPQLIVDKNQRTSYYQSILERCKNAIANPSEQLTLQSWYEILLKTHYCLGNIQAFETTATALGQIYPDIARRHLDFLIRVLDPHNPIWRDKKVFGIGLSKTGTASLSKALTLLNYSTAHWTNSYSHDLLTIEDAPLFDSLTDISISYLYKEIYSEYPNAKFVLTTRPVKKWEDSFLTHYARSLHATSFEHLKRIILDQYPPRFGQRYIDIHNKLYFQHQNLQEAFHFHEQDVLNFFKGKEDQLLLLDVSQPNAFQNFSTFLRVNCPQNDFPNVNTKEEKNSWVSPITGTTRTL